MPPVWDHRSLSVRSDNSFDDFPVDSFWFLVFLIVFHYVLLCSRYTDLSVAFGTMMDILNVKTCVPCVGSLFMLAPLGHTEQGVMCPSVESFFALGFGISRSEINMVF